jgi:MYXO-CTERM domain-containing protein
VVDFTARTEAGEAAMIGDTLLADRVHLRARVLGGAGYSLILVRNGAVDEVIPLARDDVQIELERETREEGDRYRVHIGDAFDLVITNHIWVEYAEPSPVDDGGCGCEAGATRSSAPTWLLLVGAWLVRRRSHQDATSARDACCQNQTQNSI